MSFYDICKYCSLSVDSHECKIGMNVCNGEFFEGIDVLNTTVDKLMKIFGGNEPCNFNGFDENSYCHYCTENCDSHDVSICFTKRYT